MTIGKKIQYFRKKAGYTQKQLAEACGVATGTIQQYELGKRQPRIEQLEIIADALDLHLLDLLDSAQTINLYNTYDNAAMTYYKNIGYELKYENDYLIICHNGYGYKVPNDLFIKIEDDLRLDAEYGIEKIIAKYANTEFKLEELYKKKQK